MIQGHIAVPMIQGHIAEDWKLQNRIVLIAAATAGARLRAQAVRCCLLS
jgi:hypothetical protein